MTITNTADRSTHTVSGSASSPSFSVPFKFLANSDIIVLFTLTSSGVTTTLTEGTSSANPPTEYTLTGAGDESGGSVQLHGTTSAGTLEIVRVVSATQENDYQAGGVFSAESHEDSLDKLTMIAQGAIRPLSSDPTAWDAGPPRSGSSAATTRQVKNVKAGTADTDAINKAQLDAVQTTGGNLPTVTTDDNDDMIAVVSGAWTERTPAQIKTTLGLDTGDNARFDRLGVNIDPATIADGDIKTAGDVTVGDDLTVSGRISGSLAAPLGMGAVDPSHGHVHITTSDLASSSAHADSDELVIENATTAGITIASATTGNIHFGDAADNDIGKIVYTHGDDTMTFTSATEDTLVLDAGNNQIDAKNNKIINVTTPSAGADEGEVATVGYVANVAQNWTLLQTKVVTGDEPAGSVTFASDDSTTAWEDLLELRLVATDVVAATSGDHLAMRWSTDAAGASGNMYGNTSNERAGYFWRGHTYGIPTGRGMDAGSTTDPISGPHLDNWHEYVIGQGALGGNSIWLIFNPLHNDSDGVDPNVDDGFGLIGYNADDNTIDGSSSSTADTVTAQKLCSLDMRFLNPAPSSTLQPVTRPICTFTATMTTWRTDASNTSLYSTIVDGFCGVEPQHLEVEGASLGGAGIADQPSGTATGGPWVTFPVRSFNMFMDNFGSSPGGLGGGGGNIHQGNFYLFGLSKGS